MAIKPVATIVSKSNIVSKMSSKDEREVVSGVKKLVDMLLFPAHCFRYRIECSI